MPNRHGSSKVILKVVIVLLLGVGVYGTYFFYSKYQTVKKDLSTLNGQETDILKEEVGKLIQLPSDEEPTVATISNKEELKDQDFFKEAENGDKLLVFNNAKEVILYRPSIQKIIRVAPLYIDDQADESPKTSTKEVTDSVKVAIYNGTTLPDLASENETKIINSVSDTTITEKKNAKQQTYVDTLVVDLSGLHSAVANQIAVALDGTVGSLPDGEEKPSDSDILVIAAN